MPETKCCCRLSVSGEHAEMLAFICRTCMCHKQIELQLFTCLLFMLIWMTNKANMFGCTQWSRSQKVNQLLSAKPDKTVIALGGFFYPSNNRLHIYLNHLFGLKHFKTTHHPLNQYSLIDFFLFIFFLSYGAFPLTGTSSVRLNSPRFFLLFHY